MEQMSSIAELMTELVRLVDKGIATPDIAQVLELDEETVELLIHSRAVRLRRLETAK